MNWEQKENIDDIYLEAINRRAPLNGNKCPNCNSGGLHIYVHVFEDELGKGDNWIKGSGWIWCDSCHCYDHFRGPVPEWWANIEPLKISPLDIPPNNLSKYTQEIDDRNKKIEAHF